MGMRSNNLPELTVWALLSYLLPCPPRPDGSSAEAFGQPSFTRAVSEHHGMYPGFSSSTPSIHSARLLIEHCPSSQIPRVLSSARIRSWEIALRAGSSISFSFSSAVKGRTRRGTSTEGAAVFEVVVSIDLVLSVIGAALPPIL